MGSSTTTRSSLLATVSALCATLLTLFAVEARAQQDVEITVSASPKVVAPGQVVEYQLEARVGGNYDIRVERDPRFGPFRLVGAGSAPSMINRNGQIERSLKVRYQLRAPQEHEIYTIEPPRLRVGTRSFTPNPVSVRVTAPDQVPEPSTPEGARNGVAFLDVTVEPADRDPYLGEQVTLTYELYTNARSRGLRASPPDEPALNDFWVEDLSDVVVRQRRITRLQGHDWNVSGVRGYALFPLKAGELTVEAMRLPLQRASLFGPSSQIEIEAEAVTLRVQELPDGAPAGFDRNNVGQWSMTSQLDSKSARVGGTLHYTLRITGVGRAARLKIPTLSDTEAYRVIATSDEPQQIRQGTRIHGTREVRFTLMPLQEGTLTLPELSFDYFDPEEGAYKVARVEARTIHVEPGTLPENLDEAPVDEVHRGESGQSEFDLLELAEPKLTGDLGPARAPSGTIPWWLWLLPLLGLGALAMERPLRGALAKKLGPARARRALRQELDALLEQARQAEGRARDEALLRALALVLERGFGVQTGALTAAEVQRELSTRALSEELVTKVADLVAELTRGRYAPGAGSAETLMERASALIATLFEEAHSTDDPRSRSARASRTALLIAGGAVGLCAALGSPGEAQAQAQNIAEEAARSWEAGAFEEASRSWEVAADPHNDATLWYNAGSAALRAGDLGRARLFLERAALTHAHHPDVAANLQTTVNLVSLNDANAARFGAQSPVVARALRSGPWVALGLVWLAFALAMIRRLSGRPSESVVRAAVIAALVLGLLNATLHLGIAQISGPEQLGVVLQESELRVAPSEHAGAHSGHPQLAAGAVVDRKRTREGWVEVVLPTGDVGWLPASRVEAVQRSGD
ncbi:protein BatD [Lujinxingia vulgaris]|uniref:Protein BatD n=1 Tax=Lujinxingia vulgaris TaxID=2600176 RepID=A0A5C6XDC8_9DELT|nr:BatD family protein [Lujinxingia vulgaris]TXD38458.1 protein BatD [Lujinxingia vulgaris]